MADTVIATLGDSVTYALRQGISETQTYSYLLESELRAQGLAVKVIKCGLGGETTAGALARLDQILALGPNCLTVMYGLNDAAFPPDAAEPRVPLGEYADNLKSIIARVRAAGSQPVLMTPNPYVAVGAFREAVASHPPYNTSPSVNFMLIHYANALKEVSAVERVPVVDIFSEFASLAISGVSLEERIPDGVHPDALGHRIIARALTRYFAHGLK